MIRMEIIIEKEVGVGIEKVHIQTIIAEGETGVVVIVDQGRDQEQVQIETEFRCYKCRECNHFAMDCPTTKKETRGRANLANV